MKAVIEKESDVELNPSSLVATRDRSRTLAYRDS